MLYTAYAWETGHRGGSVRAGGCKAKSMGSNGFGLTISVAMHARMHWRRVRRSGWVCKSDQPANSGVLFVRRLMHPP